MDFRFSLKQPLETGSLPNFLLGTSGSESLFKLEWALHLVTLTKISFKRPGLSRLDLVKGYHQIELHLDTIQVYAPQSDRLWCELPMLYQRDSARDGGGHTAYINDIV